MQNPTLKQEIKQGLIEWFQEHGDHFICVSADQSWYSIDAGEVNIEELSSILVDIFESRP